MFNTIGPEITDGLKTHFIIPSVFGKIDIEV
jgi:hypothetical protein